MLLTRANGELIFVGEHSAHDGFQYLTLTHLIADMNDKCGAPPTPQTLAALQISGKKTQM